MLAPTCSHTSRFLCRYFKWWYKKTRIEKKSAFIDLLCAVPLQQIYGEPGLGMGWCKRHCPPAPGHWVPLARKGLLGHRAALTPVSTRLPTGWDWQRHHHSWLARRVLPLAAEPWEVPLRDSHR